MCVCIFSAFIFSAAGVAAASAVCCLFVGCRCCCFCCFCRTRFPLLPGMAGVCCLLDVLHERCVAPCRRRCVHANIPAPTSVNSNANAAAINATNCGRFRAFVRRRHPLCEQCLFVALGQYEAEHTNTNTSKNTVSCALKSLLYDGNAIAEMRQMNL